MSGEGRAPLRSISGGELERLAELPALVRELGQALREGEKSRADVPQRSLILREEPFAAFGAMPAHSARYGLFITKVAAFVAEAPKAVNAVVVAFSARSGEPLALLDGAALTALKCAAVTALVTDLCASPGARALAVIGAGVQAREQVRAVCSVRPIQEIRVFSRDPRNVRAFIDQVSVHARGAALAAPSSADEAVSGADVVSTATSSASPVFSTLALAPHVHVNCMGAHTRESREVPRGLLERARLIVEDRPTAIAEAGELHRDAFELEALVRYESGALQRVPTVFSSTGHAFLDLVATAHVLRAAGVLAP